jgi:hypothetical protein
MSFAAAIPAAFADADPTPATAWDYRRAARRLRCHFRNDLASLHRSLRKLAADTDAARPAACSVNVAPADDGKAGVGRSTATARPVSRTADRVWRVEARVLSADARPADRSPIDVAGTAAALRASPETVDRFASLVATALDEGVLRHSRRQSLLRRGTNLGLGLFEANLVIAAVVHRHTGRDGLASPAVLVPSARRRRGWSAAVLTVAAVAVEAAALAAAVRWLA